MRAHGVLADDAQDPFDDPARDTAPAAMDGRDRAGRREDERDAVRDQHERRQLGVLRSPERRPRGAAHPPRGATSRISTSLPWTWRPISTDAGSRPIAPASVLPVRAHPITVVVREDPEVE